MQWIVVRCEMHSVRMRGVMRRDTSFMKHEVRRHGTRNGSANKILYERSPRVAQFQSSPAYVASKVVRPTSCKRSAS